uniref:Secreted protein n=1 Tax=Steinernema glaseri TaxID=37863 RepID=A0A1I7YDR2_9BILA
MQPIIVLHLIVVAVLCHHIDGYTLDQLLSAKGIASAEADDKPPSMFRIADGNALATDLSGPNHSKKSLKKFQGNGSRNCFFSPITCMIHHDVNKYRKLVDNSYYGAGGVSKRLW